MTSPVKDKVQQFGLTEVYCAPDPQVDVVFVHGLNGHPYNTWASHNPEVFWPTDLLPEVIEGQHCRLLTYGYDANVTAFTDGASKDHIHNHAEHLAARLVANRSVRARERPLIFVAHSLGGLVVKRLLIYCESINNPKLERLRSIYVSTFGILFLGTPHNGSDLAKWGSLLQSICAAAMPKKWLDSSPQLVNALKSNNETLQNINRLFVEIMEPLRIYFFHEGKPMDLKATREFVVDEDSAAPVMQGVERMGIEKNHSAMCKFEALNAPGFDVVSDAIASYADEAPSKVRGRWEREKRVRGYYRQSIASELLGDDILNIAQFQQQQQQQQVHGSSETSTARASAAQSMESSVHSITPPNTLSSQSLTKHPRVAPLLFRPNTIFVGFDVELHQLKHILSSEKKSKIGTTSVLICGPPGSGKSHLAREYVWTHQADYPAGIFWVDCKSRQKRDRYFWDIGQALGCLEGAFQTDYSFVQAVRKCLESLQGWLIVFDGIFFDSDEQLSDFVPYLPDSSGNSIIYTSIDPTLKRRHRLLNPSWVRMRPLSTPAALKLLFKSLGIHEYNSTQQRKAEELVRYYGRLPLGIHAAAHMLIAQGRALETFSPATTSDKRLINPFLEIVQALARRGYDAAVTLLVLLCMLNHKVPVALLLFGASSISELGHEIVSTDHTGGAKKDLDNTISVLLRYGMVERELQTSSAPALLQSKSPILSRAPTRESVASRAMLSHSEDSSDLKLITMSEDQESNGSSTSMSIAIDTLRTHTITQSIVREEVRSRGIQGVSYNDWLVIASRFLCASYRTAAARLAKLPGQGSVADYREYESHVSTLRKFLARSNKDVPTSVSRAQEELKNVHHDIRLEIRLRSPSQSRSSGPNQLKYFGSVFETSADYSDEEPFTPLSEDLTPAVTWSANAAGAHGSPQEYVAPNWPYAKEVPVDVEDGGYATDLDDFAFTPRSSPRWSTASDATALPMQSSESNQRRSLVLQAILRGHSAISSSHKDLGEFKPVPTVGRISSPDIQSMRPRSVSSSSSSLPWPFRSNTSGSTAEASLSAFQAKSPTTGSLPFSERKSSLGSEGKDRPATEVARQPLSDRPPNIIVPVTILDPSHFPPDMIVKSPEFHQYAKPASTSPRLANAVLTRQANKVWDELPIEDASVSRPYPVQRNAVALPFQARTIEALQTRPSGYTSLPMSRDVSRESNNSLLSAPTVAVHASSFREPTDLDSYEYSSRGMQSIDMAMARSLDFNQTGTWTNHVPFGLEDDLRDFDLNRTESRTAPSSAPLSPNPGLAAILRGTHLDVVEQNLSDI